MRRSEGSRAGGTRQETREGRNETRLEGQDNEGSSKSIRTSLFVLCLCLLLAHVEASMPPSCKPVNARNDNADLNTFSTIAKEMGLPLGLSSSSAEEEENDDDEPSEQRLLWNASTAGKIYDIELALRRSASLEKFNKDGITSLHMAISEREGREKRGEGGKMMMMMMMMMMMRRRRRRKGG